MKVCAVLCVLFVLALGVAACGGSDSTVQVDHTAGLASFATLEGPNMPASVDEFTFNSNMVATKVFHVDGRLAVRAAFFDGSPEAGSCVEGYLLPANAPRDPAAYLDNGQVFTLTDYSDATMNGRVSWWEDLHGDYYVVAAGQDCTWSLDVMK